MICSNATMGALWFDKFDLIFGIASLSVQNLFGLLVKPAILNDEFLMIRVFVDLFECEWVALIQFLNFIVKLMYFI